MGLVLYSRSEGGYNLKNKGMAFCFSLLWLATAGPAAAEPSAVRLTSTVKASPRSGRLVRSTVVSKPASRTSARPPAEIEALVQSAAEAHQVDPLLIESVIKVESNFNPMAVSPKGAMGLMQLIPSTAKRFGAENAFDARQNIEAGVKYLKLLRDTFQDDKLALAAYNAGEGAVLRHGGVPPYRETQEYVVKVKQRYEDALKQKRQAAPVEASPAHSAGEPPMRAVEMFTDESGRIHMRTRDH